MTNSVGDGSILDHFMDKIPPLQKQQVRMKMQVAVQIEEALIAKGWSQKEFAQKMGKRESEVSKWLSGKQNFTLDTLVMIEDALGVAIVLVPMFALRQEDPKPMPAHSESVNLGRMHASPRKIVQPLNAQRLMYPISIQQNSLQPLIFHERSL